jgi:hypothetical protein
MQPPGVKRVKLLALLGELSPRLVFGMEGVCEIFAPKPREARVWRIALRDIGLERKHLYFIRGFLTRFA